MKKRSPVLVLLFSLITCGIYYLYWYVVTTNEIEHELKHPDGSCKSGGMTILFMIITCGIYTFYWWFKQGKRTAQLQQERNLVVSDNSVIYLVLCFFGIGSIINTILLQSSLNKIAEAPAAPTAPPEA